MQITCLRFEVLTLDENGRAALSADLMLDDTGVVLKGVRMADMPDGSVDLKFSGSGVAFVTPFYERAFIALAVQSVMKVKLQHEMTPEGRVKAISDATTDNMQISRLVN